MNKSGSTPSAVGARRSYLTFFSPLLQTAPFLLLTSSSHKEQSLATRQKEFRSCHLLLSEIISVCARGDAVGII